MERGPDVVRRFPVMLWELERRHVERVGHAARPGETTSLGLVSALTGSDSETWAALARLVEMLEHGERICSEADQTPVSRLRPVEIQRQSVTAELSQVEREVLALKADLETLAPD